GMFRLPKMFILRILRRHLGKNLVSRNTLCAIIKPRRYKIIRMNKYQNINKKDARILTIITFINTLFWLCFFYFGSLGGVFGELIDSPNTFLTFIFFLMILGAFILPFFAIYYWHLENFNLRSK